MTDEELEEAVAQVGEQLQAIQDHCGRANREDGRVRFPRGFIRTAAEIRADLPNLGTRQLQQNLSYPIMMLDVLRWLAVRTDLAGAALSMVVKECICILGTICETLTKEALRGNGSKASFVKRTEKLVANGLIDAPLKAEIDWIWEIRCREHLYGLDALEHDRYGRADYNRALKAYVAFRDALRKHHPR